MLTPAQRKKEATSIQNEARKKDIAALKARIRALEQDTRALKAWRKSVDTARYRRKLRRGEYDAESDR